MIRQAAGLLLCPQSKPPGDCSPGGLEQLVPDYDRVIKASLVRRNLNASGSEEGTIVVASHAGGSRSAKALRTFSEASEAAEEDARLGGTQSEIAGEGVETRHAEAGNEIDRGSASGRGDGG